MTTNETFMKRAFNLARLGMGKVSPNPLVGCVIVYNDEIIGEGYHQVYGGPHAEVNAISSVRDKSLLKEATIYVTLEPCAHHGKTPPCADLIVKHGLKKVVIANVDPNPKVAGRGISRLREAGIAVEEGVMEEVGKELNKRFFTYMNQKRPFIILKWAQTADHFIARKNYDSKWISDQYSRKLVHKWRAEEDSIMVGTNTARYDNPSLNVRDWEGKDPVRIVIDKHLSLPNQLNLFATSQPTICYNYIKTEESEFVKWVKLDEDQIEEQIMTDLYSRGIQSVIVEGGAYLLNTLISKNLWDEARVFKSQSTFVEGIKAPVISGTLKSSQQLVNDQLEIYSNHG